jgi:hypothetical protein
MERMIRTQFRKQVFNEGRDPISIPFVNLPGEPDEGHEVLLILHFFKLEFLSCHRHVFRPIRPNEYKRILSAYAEGHGLCPWMNA